MQRVLNIITSLVLITLILCIQSLSTVLIFTGEGDFKFIELVELTEETEESNESDENKLEEDAEDLFISNYFKLCSSICEIKNKSDQFISLYKSFCLDIKGAPPDLC